MKTLTKAVLVAVMVSFLSGCFLTKLVSTPMRVAGAGVSVVGAAVSIVPVVGNAGDEALEKVDGIVDGAADSLDKVPL